MFENTDSDNCQSYNLPTPNSMSNKQDNRQQICWKLEPVNIQIVSQVAQQKHLSKARVLDLIVSQWYEAQLNKQADTATAKQCIQKIKDTVESLDKRLSRIESNMVSQGSILAK